MSIIQEISDAIAAEFSDLGDAGTVAAISFRLLLAGLLGGALGFERESRGKAAGLRTHMLVAIGAAIFVAPWELDAAHDTEMSRVIQGLIAGIGFLGAGAIVKGKPGEETQGLTTAAGIWVTAAIGVTVGMGRAGTALLSTALALIVLAAIDRLANWIHPGNGHHHAKAKEENDEKE